MSVFLDRAREAMAAGDLETVLDRVTSMYRALGWSDEYPLFPAGVREADRLLEEAGRALLGDGGGAHSRPLEGDLVLATLLYGTGGHTAVIADLAAALPAPPAALWLTMAHPGARLGGPRPLERSGLAEVATVFEGDTLESARRLVEELKALRPARVFLLHHPDDCVAVVAAAAAAAMGSSVCLLHHADMYPSAGLYLSGAKIVDFTPRACGFTRSMLGLPSDWLPLTCPDPGTNNRSFMTTGKVVTAVSGAYAKIAAMSFPPYPELVASILECTGGTHVHVGPLFPPLAAEIEEALSRSGLDRGRFIPVPEAPTLVHALKEHAVDLLLATYPYGGARTAVEAMAAAVPVTWRSPTADLDDVDTQMKYPGAFIWRTPDDLRDLLTGLDTSWLRRQGASARGHYEKLHHPRFWSKYFSSLDSASGRELPAGFDAAQVTRFLVEHRLGRKGEG